MSESGRNCRRAPSAHRAAAVILDAVARLPTPSTAGLAGLTCTTDRAPLPLDTDLRTVSERIGRHAVSGAVLARFAADLFSVPEAPRPVETPDAARLDRRAHWRHAIEVAALAEGLNNRSDAPDDPERVCAAALLHDVGKLALDVCMPKAYARVRLESRRRRCDQSHLEWTRLGVDHARVGRFIAARWRLPGPVRDAVGLHQDAPAATRHAAPDAALVAKVQLADRLAHREPFGHPARADRPTLEALSAIAGVSLDDTDARRREFADRARVWIDVMGPMLSARSAGRAPSPSLPVSPFPPPPTPAAPARAPWNTPRWTQALAEFAQRIQPDDRLTTVCLHIVECCVDTFRIDSAVAFVHDDRGDLYHCGVRRADQSATTAVLLPDRAVTDRWPPAVAALLSRAIIPPPPVAEPVLERFRRLFTAGPAVMLPIVHDRTLLGGVLFNAGAIRIPAPNGIDDAVHALVSVFGAAVSQAARQFHVDRDNDALAAAHRCRAAAPSHLAQAHTLSTLAETAAGAAHELNTPLAVIAGRAQMLARTADDPDDRRTLETIRQSSHACSEIVDQLMAFAKPAPPEPASIALESWFERLGDRWAADARAGNISLTFRRPDANAGVYADPAQLETVIDALIANAAEALPPAGGWLVVNSRFRPSDDTVVITVEDNGCGMSGDVLERACDPFFSHRPAGRGRGLGLSIALRLVEANRGRLWLESQPDVGTTAFVELPARDVSRDL